MKARIDLVYTTESHDNQTEFPYSEAELAHALAFLTRYPGVCDSLQELDSSEAPVGQQDSVEWHCILAE